MNVMSFKAKIRKYAETNGIAAQVVLQNFMFERFLLRLTKTQYKDKFVIKGGVLVAALVGLDTRATMDLDATLRNLPLTETQILQTIRDICKVEVSDDTEFEVMSVSPIRDEDEYGGFRIAITAKLETIIVPFTVDISTGDIITPEPVEFDLVSIFDDEIIHLWGYNVETVLAEKVETILSRGALTTRPRDYYDVYILNSTQKFKKEVFKKALLATAEHRGSIEQISNSQSILQYLKNDKGLQEMWERYRKKFDYANNIGYSDIMTTLENLLLN